MRNVKSPDEVPRRRGESEETYRMKRLLVALGLKLGFMVDVEEPPDSELGELGIRHDVIWYTRPPEWFTRLLKIASLRDDLEPDYRHLIEAKLRLERQIHAAFEIEGKSKLMTKTMKGDILNLSKWPYGVIVVRWGREEVREEGQVKKPVRNRFERALMEFRKLYGPNNVIIVSFRDVEELCRSYGITS